MKSNRQFNEWIERIRSILSFLPTTHYTFIPHFIRNISRNPENRFEVARLFVSKPLNKPIRFIQFFFSFWFINNISQYLCVFCSLFILFILWFQFSEVVLWYFFLLCSLFRFESLILTVFQWLLGRENSHKAEKTFKINESNKTISKK